MPKLVLISLIAGLVAATSLSADSFTVISQPAAFYTSSTTLIGISGMPDNMAVDKVFGGGLTVKFTPAMVKLSVPLTWGTWNYPPAVESHTPAILYSKGKSDVLMSLSTPELTFGFEAQPDLSDVESMKATFFDASDNKLGTITLDVSGNAGALLFAATSTTPIASVDFSGPTGKDFAVANLRFSNKTVSVPESAAVLQIAFWAVAGVFMLLWHVYQQRRTIHVR